MWRRGHGTPLRPWRVAIAAVISHDELGADFVDFGGADRGVAGEGFLPVVPGLNRVADDFAGAGEAAMGAGLLVLVADLGGQA